jgi:hypothetical protein
MRWRRIAGATAALLAGACAAPMQWTKAGATPDERQRDLSECRRQAWREGELPAGAAAPRAEVPSAVILGPGGAPSVVMAQPAGDPFAGWPRREREFAASCMRAKGYALEHIRK